jgi:phage terminase large subunit-like protein
MAKKKTKNKRNGRTRRSAPTLRRSGDPVRDYAQNVVAGKIIACRWNILACRRHLADLKRRDVVWDLEAALHRINFFRDVLRLNGGQFEGKPFVLEPLQAFVVGSIFGWMLRDGRRRFNTAYMEIAKGWGKSPLAAGVGHCMMFADDEARAEIYSAAVKKDQAMILFRDAVAMRDQSPHLAARLVKSGVGEKCWNLADHQTGSWFRPISSDEDSQSGPRPHCALVDEVHEHKSSVVIDMLSAGFKTRRNPLMFMITNSGFDRESVCWRWHEYVTKILKGTAENDNVFGMICTLDACEKHWLEGQEQPVDNCKKCDDWATEGPHWRKANPNLGVSIMPEYLRAQVRKGLDMPAEQNTVRRLNFGFWTNQATRWLSMQAWDLCNAPIDYDKLRGRQCIMGLDLANKIDIAALVLLFPPEKLALQAPAAVEGAMNRAPTPDHEHDSDTITYAAIDIEKLTEDFVVVPYFFIPRDTITEAMRRDDVPYDAWVREGLMEATEGNVIDYEAIKRRIKLLNDVHPIRVVRQDNAAYHLLGFDPWNAQEFSNDMQARHSINMIKVGQGYRDLSEPTKEMGRLIRARKVRHGGHPVLRWMADNMIVRIDPAGNIKPDKEKSKKKIDGIVALIIALALAIRHQGDGRSVYADRGVRAI